MDNERHALEMTSPIIPCDNELCVCNDLEGYCDIDHESCEERMIVLPTVINLASYTFSVTP